jgi:hypothetical protein
LESASGQGGFPPVREGSSIPAAALLAGPTVRGVPAIDPGTALDGLGDDQHASLRHAAVGFDSATEAPAVRTSPLAAAAVGLLGDGHRGSFPVVWR